MNSLDDQFRAWCATTEPASRLTVLGWPKRLDELAVFFPAGLEAGPQLASIELRLDALYWVAVSLHLGGYPGRSLTAFGQHEELCREVGPTQARRLATAMAVHAKSLRQCGRLHDADLLAREGLELQQRSGSDDALIGINLYSLGIGLTQRGDPSAAAALHAALKTLSEVGHPAAKLYSAQCALADRDFDTALSAGAAALAESFHAEEDPNAIDEIGARRIRCAAARIVGEATVELGGSEGTTFLRTALNLAGEIQLVEEVLPALLALAKAALRQNNFVEARRWLDAAFVPAHQGPYRLEDCNAHLQLAELELHLGNPAVAHSAARRALALAECDGGVFRYEQGIIQATAALQKT